MTQAALHPWLSTPDAYRAAQRSVRIPLYKLPGRAHMIGHDELLSEALSLLTECALPPREEVQTVCAYCQGLIPGSLRKNAKYCSPQCSSNYRNQRSRGTGKMASADLAPAHPKTHIGSMWTWPEADMTAYAIREVGFRLCHYVAQGKLETPSTPAISNLALAAAGDADEAQHARDLIEQYLEGRGVRLEGTETVDDLAEAVGHLKAVSAATA